MKYPEKRDKRDNRGKRAKDTLRELGVTPSRMRGQNFLTSETALDEILQFGEPRVDERLVEIGPGLGAMTKRLASVAPLTVIEIEPEFCKEIRDRHPDVTVREADFTRFDLAELVRPPGERLTLFGNLPYSRSTDIVTRVLDQSEHVSRAVFLLQKEFAERLAAPPGGRDYGTISIAVGTRAVVRLGPTLGGELFHPPTKVTSRLIELSFPKPAPYDVEDPAWLRRVVHAAFQQRRRKIVNSLLGSGFFPPEDVHRSLEAAGIEPGRRAETVTVAEFLSLAAHLRQR